MTTTAPRRRPQEPVTLEEAQAGLDTRQFERVAKDDCFGATAPELAEWLRSDDVVDRFHTVLARLSEALHRQLTDQRHPNRGDDDWRRRVSSLARRIDDRLAEIGDHPVVGNLQSRVDELEQAIRCHRTAKIHHSSSDSSEADQELWALLGDADGNTSAPVLDDGRDEVKDPDVEIDEEER